MIILKAPPPDLAHIIEACWTYTPTPNSGLSGRAFHDLSPGGGMDLVMRVSDAGSRMVLLGQAAESANVEIDRDACYLGVRFRPGRTPALVDASPRELLNSHVDLNGIQIGGRTTDSLADEIHASANPLCRLRIIQKLVRNAPPLIRDKRCRRAMTMIEMNCGATPVDELARTIGTSRRSLERLFALHAGLSPKHLSRLIRMQKLTAQLRAGGYADMAALALHFGYSDQSHMIRDVRSLTGHTPVEIIKKPMEYATENPTRDTVHRCKP